MGDYNPDMPLSLSRQQWLATMKLNWRQGQHIAVMGRTGRGKTTLARDLLALREWAVVLGVKREDDTLATFPKAGFRKITSWPPRYEDHHVLLWARPKDLHDVAGPRATVAKVLSDVYKHGGWAVLLDDTAYLANQLGFRKDIAVLLNQARSSHASIVCAFTQPSSVTAAIPSEVWRQVRYHLVFFYRVGRDLDSIADITGYNKSQLTQWMKLLGPWDFLAFDDLTDTVTIVRT